VWGHDDFFKIEIEVEHLLGSTPAAASSEPVWREKVVMPVLESSACADIRLLLRTFRGEAVEWQVLGSASLSIAALGAEDDEWLEVFAKRWASRPDLVPIASLNIKVPFSFSSINICSLCVLNGICCICIYKHARIIYTSLFLAPFAC